MKARSLFTLAATTILTTSLALGQGFHGGGPGGPGGDSHMGGGMGSSFHIVPPGMWWKNADLVTKLTLTPDQQKRMDDIFEQSRIELVHIKATLEEQQILLEPLLNANPPDSAKTLAQISKIADSRASLEKANAKMLLGLRGVLTADQWTKLQAEEHAHRGMRGQGGPGRPDGAQYQRGPGGQGGPGGRGRGQGPAPSGATPPAPPNPAE